MRILLLLCFVIPALGIDVQPYIIDGGVADFRNSTHQLSLRVNGVHSCGASLISSTRAVSSAQCTAEPIGVYTVLGGTADRTVTNCETCVLRDLNLISRHPNFDNNLNTGYRYDVSVIGFAAVILNINLNTISLATPVDGDFSDSICITTGWGATIPGGDHPDMLRSTELIAMANPECELAWDDRQISGVHLCADGDGEGAICDGDQGGPLVCGEFSHLLAGVTSWGDEDCDPLYPSVFTRVSLVSNWIEEQ
jgi:hypothetical protein